MKLYRFAGQYELLFSYDAFSEGEKAEFIWKFFLNVFLFWDGGREIVQLLFAQILILFGRLIIPRERVSRLHLEITNYCLFMVTDDRKIPTFQTELLILSGQATISEGLCMHIASGKEKIGSFCFKLKDEFTFWNMLYVLPVFRVEYVTCFSSCILYPWSPSLCMTVGGGFFSSTRFHNLKTSWPCRTFTDAHKKSKQKRKVLIKKGCWDVFTLNTGGVTIHSP